MKRRIVVHDDVFGSRFVKKLRSVDSVSRNFEVDLLTPRDFPGEMDKLTDRRRLRGKKDEYDSVSEFDSADVFVVDFDLIKSDKRMIWDSELVSYLTRCFSNCGLIVGLNLPSCYEFELTLGDDLNSYADLNIVGKQLYNRGLWADETKGFRPWYWPQLLRQLDNFVSRVKDVEKNLDRPICEVIGLTEIAELLPKSASQFVEGKDILKTTFRDFVCNLSGGLRTKDRNPVIETICRIAAARISKWLERKVLAGQNVIVDAPHLVSRLPSLLKEGGSLKSLNRTTSFSDCRELGLDHAKIDEFRVKKSHWFSRPVWHWRKIAEYAKISEISAPWEKESLRYKFCEDASKFYPQKSCNLFRAGVDSPYDRRYLKRFPGVDYQPIVRLLGR